LFWVSFKKNQLVSILIFLLLLSSTLAFMYYRFSYDDEYQPVYFVDDSSERRVAFTFEVLWKEGYITPVLKELDKQKVNATFFLTGSWLKENPDKARDILLKGNEIGNHTYSHRSLLMVSEKEIHEEISSFNQLSREVLEYTPLLFRPPYGEYNNLLLEKSAQQGHITVLWSLDGGDYYAEDSQEIIDNVVPHLYDGAIINFKLSSPHLPQALPKLVEKIKEAGYSISCVSKLIEEKS